jgi:hypothetical protein
LLFIFVIYNQINNLFRVFTISPEAQELFSKFSNVPFDELPGSEQFSSHALQLAETLTLAVTSLDDLEGLSLVLKDLGAAHSDRELKDVHFDVSH